MNWLNKLFGSIKVVRPGNWKKHRELYRPYHKIEHGVYYKTEIYLYDDYFKRRTDVPIYKTKMLLKPIWLRGYEIPNHWLTTAKKNRLVW